MRHLLFPGTCQPYSPPPTRRARLAAWWARTWRALCGEFHETADRAAGLFGWADAGTVAAMLVLAWPTTPAPGGAPSVAVYNWLVQLVIVIVAAVVAAAMAPKPPVPKPAALQDFDVPMAEEGRPIPKVFGEWLVKDPNVLWYGDLATTAIKTKSGKK